MRACSVAHTLVYIPRVDLLEGHMATDVETLTLATLGLVEVEIAEAHRSHHDVVATLGSVDTSIEAAP